MVWKPALLALLFTASAALAAEPAKPKKPEADRRITALIDKLTETTEGDVGYIDTITAEGAFAPFQYEGQVQTLRLDVPPPTHSETFRRLVREGANALPALLAHLTDKRPTKYVIKHESRVGMLLALPEDLPAPAGKETAGKGKGQARERAGGLPTSYTVKVGDLCYVAVGQIVNRNYTAVSYIPTAITLVNSPVQMPKLAAEVRKEWAGTTAAKHRAALVRDLLQPQDENRRFGAWLRLAYYYPNMFEAHALKLLKDPVYDGSAAAELLRDHLYVEEAGQRRKAFQAYVRGFGKLGRDALEVQLFKDLAELEAWEKDKEHNPRPAHGDLPRRVLIQLYAKKKDVRTTERPTSMDGISEGFRRRLIQDGLIYDHSRKLDRAVRDMLVSVRDEDALALALIHRLVARGYDADIEAYCRRRLSKVEDDDREALRAMLDRLGWSPLHVAAERGDLDAVRDLLRGGADVNARARNGRTPLHPAAEQGHAETVGLLLDARADPDALDCQMVAPVELAARNEDVPVVRLLVSRGGHVRGVLAAVLAGKRDVVEKLLKGNPAAVRDKTRREHTPLHLAVLLGDVRMAEVVLAHGADVSAEDLGGWTPLLWATEMGACDLVALLLRHKADVNCQTPGDMFTPLHLAARAGNVQLVNLLLEHGANPQRKDEMGKTPLHLALADDYFDVARLLLKHHADPEARDHSGETPLELLVGSRAAERAARRLRAGQALRQIRNLAEIEGYHGRVQVDERRPGQPAVAVTIPASGMADDDLAPYLADLPTLERLDLGHARMTDQALPGLGKLVHLRQLSLSGTKITDTGLAKLEGLSQLEEFDLSDTGITDAGLTHLAGLKQLRELELNHTKVGDAGLKYLKDLPALRRVELSGSNVSGGGIAALQKARPDLVIAHEKRTPTQPGAERRP